MTWLELLLIALVQGITEFLPISSSAHLILLPFVMGTEDQGLLMDVAVHVGTLLAVMVYLRRDVQGLVMGLYRWIRGEMNVQARMAMFLLIATLPIIVTGVLLKDYMESLRSIEVIATTTLIYGVLLWWIDARRPEDRDLRGMRLNEAFLIGMAQVLALIPGTSRSGITMTAGRAFGLNRSESARFAMLLAIPTIAGAGLLGALDVYEQQDFTLARNALLAMGLSFLTALLAIRLMMNWLRTSSFLPFVIYRVVLAAVLFGWLLFQ